MSEIAQAIAERLACGRSGCLCTGTAKRGHGKTHCPAHDDRTPSLSVSEKGGRVLVKDFGSCTQQAVIEELRERGLWPSPPRRDGRRASRTVQRWQVRDEHSELQAVHCRKERPDGKEMWWEQADGRKGLGGRRVEGLPLYGAERLRELPDGAVVVVTEGEKACDALRGLEVVAVATVTGAAGTPGDDALRPLVHLAPRLWEDNDAKGTAHMGRIAQRLHALGARSSIIHWPAAPPKGDAADFVTQGGTPEHAQALLDAAEPWEPVPPEDTGVLLSELVAFVRRYIIMNGEQADAVALWTAHTHVFDAAEVTPYLNITSAEKRSGKTRLLDVLSLLVARPWKTGRVTSAVLVRKIDAEAPALLLDEIDAAFKGDKEYSETLRSVLNTGYEREGTSSLCVGQGADISYHDFSTFCPKALAGIGKLPDTVEDRSIRIELKRKRPGESVERFRRRKAKEAARPLRGRLERWAFALVDSLRDAEPELPDALDDRAADVWEPLLAIADSAEGDWPQRARKAALALSMGAGRDDDSLRVRLLADIRATFIEKCVDKLASKELAEALAANEEAPWGDLRGKPLETRQLASMLKPYDVGPHQVRFADKTLKGYECADFEDAWARYLPPLNHPGSETSETSETKPASEWNPEGENVSAVSDVSRNRGMESALAGTGEQKKWKL